MNIAVLCQPEGLTEYQRLALRSLSRVPGVRLSFCFHLAVPHPPLLAKPETLSAIRRVLVKRLFPKGHLEQRVPLESCLENLPRLPLVGERIGRFSVYLTESSSGFLRDLQLDAIVNFTTHILKGSILSIPRYGVWSYHHGDPTQFRGYPPGFWEIYHGAPETGCILQKLEEALDDGVILRVARLPTVFHDYQRQKEQLFLACIPWLAEVAEQILVGDPPSMVKTTPPTRAPIYSRPSTRELLFFCLRLVGNKIRYGLLLDRGPSPSSK